MDGSHVVQTGFEAPLRDVVGREDNPNNDTDNEIDRADLVAEALTYLPSISNLKIEISTTDTEEKKKRLPVLNSNPMVAASGVASLASSNSLLMISAALDVMFRVDWKRTGLGHLG